MSTDLTAALVNARSAEIASQIQYAVAAKMLKTAQARGDNILQLVEAAAEGMDEALADVISAVGHIDIHA